MTFFFYLFDKGRFDLVNLYITVPVLLLKYRVNSEYILEYGFFSNHIIFPWQKWQDGIQRTDSNKLVLGGNNGNQS